MFHDKEAEQRHKNVNMTERATVISLAPSRCVTA